jgi:hypothetical protein
MPKPEQTDPPQVESQQITPPASPPPSPPPPKAEGAKPTMDELRQKLAQEVKEPVPLDQFLVDPKFWASDAPSK